MVMFWVRLTFALIFLGFAARAGAADPATNAAPSTHAAPALAATNAAPGAATNAPSSAKPKKKPKTAPVDGDALATTAPPPPYTGPFPRPLDSYGDEASTDVFTVLANRAFADKFNLVATIIFLLAIIHTFFAPRILAWSHSLQDEHEERLQQLYGNAPGDDRPHWQSIPAAILHFFGEVEVVFGLWTVPLAVAMFIEKGPSITREYFDQDVSYVEPLFVVVIMAIAASRPVVDFAVRVLELMAGTSPARWWIALLTFGPLLGSFITEPAAMTICALLLGREFYRLGPSPAFKYATLGLLFVNISVGGAMTNFAAPPVLIIADKWDWSSLYMLQQFGVRALAGIVVANGVYFLIFRKQFEELAEYRAVNPPQEPEGLEPVPFWVSAVHFAFLAWTVVVAHEPALFIGGFLFFLGFATSTAAYQEEINLRPPMLVGFFLAGLVVHGGLQGWWIEPMISRLTEYPLLIGATVLTAFNDNAAVTYLATLVPNLADSLKAAVVSGAIAGGGLTVIANAPNPAGQSLLQRYFPDGGVKPGALFVAALFPTLVMLALFALPR
jgi:hypothetical protein